MSHMLTRTWFIPFVLLFGCTAETATNDLQSNSEVDPSNVVDTMADSDVLEHTYVVQETRGLEIDGAIHRLTIHRAVENIDTLDNTYRITLESDSGNVFDIEVSKDEFLPELNDSTGTYVGLVGMEFKKWTPEMFWFRTYLSSRDARAKNRIDFMINCMEPGRCQIMEWLLNGKGGVIGCWA